LFAGGKDPNNNLAYIWYCTAAQLGSSDGKAGCERIAPLLQSAEREQADRVVRNKVDDVRKKGGEK